MKTIRQREVSIAGALAVLAAFALMGAGAVSLTSCSTLGLAPAKNLEGKILYGYAGITASLNTLAQATSAGLVTPNEATAVNLDILGVKGELDQALSLVCGSAPPTVGSASAGRYCESASNSPSAAAIIGTATVALTQISTYIACKQVKEPSCQLP